jgi:hypothetical protein
VVFRTAREPGVARGWGLSVVIVARRARGARPDVLALCLLVFPAIADHDLVFGREGGAGSGMRAARRALMER